MIKKIFFGLLAVILILILVAFFLPSRWAVEESIEIQRSPETIYPYLANFKQWENWTVWTKEDYDPSMTYRYQGIEGQVGFQQYWEGKKGKGVLTLNQLTANRYVQYHIEMEQCKFDGALELFPQNGNTKIVWKCFGNNDVNPVSKLIQFIFKPFIKADFKKGLQKLKTLIEQLP